MPFGPRGLKAIALFVLAVVVIAKTLAAFAVLVRGYLAVHYDWKLELGLVVGQVLFQWMVLLRRTWQERFSYAWVVIAVSSLGAALLWPLLVLAKFASPLAAVGYFFCVVAVMFAVHARLVGRHGLPWWLSGTWVVYRAILLVVLVRW